MYSEHNQVPNGPKATRGPCSHRCPRRRWCRRVGLRWWYETTTRATWTSS